MPKTGWNQLAPSISDQCDSSTSFHDYHTPVNKIMKEKSISSVDKMTANQSVFTAS